MAHMIWVLNLYEKMGSENDLGGLRLKIEIVLCLDLHIIEYLIWSHN